MCRTRIGPTCLHFTRSADCGLSIPADGAVPGSSRVPTSAPVYYYYLFQDAIDLLCSSGDEFEQDKDVYSSLWHRLNRRRRDAHLSEDVTSIHGKDRTRLLRQLARTKESLDKLSTHLPKTMWVAPAEDIATAMVECAPDDMSTDVRSAVEAEVKRCIDDLRKAVPTTVERWKGARWHSCNCFGRR